MEKLFGELDDDIIKDYMINFMTVNDISLYCSTNREYSEICNDNELWGRLVNRDFGIGYNSGIEIINILNNGERNYYELYKILSDIYKFDEEAIFMLIKIYLDTDRDKNIISVISNNLLIGKNITELKNIYRLVLTMRRDLNRGKNIFPELITENERYEVVDIINFLIGIQNRINERILLIILSMIKTNGKKLLSKLDKARLTNDNYVIKLKEYQNLDNDTIILINSRTEESYWYILSLLSDFYSFLPESSFLTSLINKNIDNETKVYLFNHNINLDKNIKETIISFYSKNNIFDNFIPANPEFISLINRTLKFVKGYYIDDKDEITLKDPSEENVESIINIFLEKYNLYETRNISVPTVYRIHIPSKYRHVFNQFI